MPGPKPQLSALTFVGFHVNSTIENGAGDISFEDVYESLEGGTLLEMLNERIPNQFDFGLFKGEQSVALNSVLLDAAAAFQGRERRKSGVEKSGLHLVMVLILEAIQRHDWVDDARRASAAN